MWPFIHLPVLSVSPPLCVFAVCVFMCVLVCFVSLPLYVGEPSLEYLRSMETEAIKRELGRFKGVGPKTVSCVLMFTLLRPEFPVDTHGEW